MISSITKSQVRDMCDQASMKTAIDSDGDIYTVLSADSDFNHNVFVFFQVTDDKWLRVFGMAEDFKVSQSNVANALIRINKYNQDQRLMKAYLEENGLIIVERNELIDEAVSEKFVYENVIRLSASFIWDFFKNFNN